MNRYRVKSYILKNKQAGRQRRVNYPLPFFFPTIAFLLAGILSEEENQELSNDLNIEEITSVLKDITDKIDDNI